MPIKTRWLREIITGIRNLLLHKMRSVLTMLGMVFGVSSVIAMLAVGQGASEEALEKIRSLGSHNILIDAMKPMEEAGSQNISVRLSLYGLAYDDLDRINETIPFITSAVPVKLLRQQAQLEGSTMDMRVVGTTPEWFNLVQRPLVAGRTLSHIDLERQKRVAVLTERGARRLLATNHPLGEQVRIGGVLFEVIGIITSQEVEGASIQSPDRQTDAYIPLSTARGRFGDIQSRQTSGGEIRERVELHQIIVKVDALNHVEPAADGIEFMLKRFHKQTDYQMHVPLTLLKQAEDTRRTFNIVLGSISSISLLVGGIGIMNIMLASVTERTREIGVRRAIGAKRYQIIRQFLIETMVLSTIGGMIGIVVGVVVPNIITAIAGMPTSVTSESLVLALGISMSTGIVFGIYPAARAAHLDPITALRHQ